MITVKKIQYQDQRESGLQLGNSKKKSSCSIPKQKTTPKHNSDKELINLSYHDFIGKSRRKVAIRNNIVTLIYKSIYGRYDMHFTEDISREFNRR